MPVTRRYTSSMLPARFIGFYLLLFFGLSALNVSVYHEIFAPPVVMVTVFEVGKGDHAILVHSPHTRRTLLIDTGPDASILRALGGALPMWQRSIDAVILTGTKASFIGGLPALESQYAVSTHIGIGENEVPYGTSFSFDDSHIKIIAPATLSISYGVTVFNISSSTPSGTYRLDGSAIKKEPPI